MLVFLQCVGEAVAANGVKALAHVVPFGEVLHEILNDAYERFRQKCDADRAREEVVAVARAAAEEVKAAAADVARSAGGHLSAEQRDELVNYLVTVPDAIRRSFRRPADPAGATAPSGLVIDRPEALAALVPAGLPRFRAGQRPPGLNWELVELLGTGGFGEVWLARNPHLENVRAALKFCLDPAAASSLRHEAALLNRIMSQNKHPGLVPLRQAYLDHDPPCLEYEYVAGGDLTAVVRRLAGLDGAKREQQAAQVLGRLAAIVGTMHRLDPPIVHRDLKPSNVLVQTKAGGRFDLRVTDFGIGGVAASRALGGDGRKPSSRGGVLATSLRGSHTPLYASPQQAAGETPSVRDDVYSLGVIWYQLLVGRPEEGVGPSLADDLRDAGVSAATAELVGRCVARKPEKRPADAAELARLVEGLPAATPYAAAAAPVAPAEPPAPKSKVRRRPRPSAHVEELAEARRGGGGGLLVGMTVLVLAVVLAGAAAVAVMSPAVRPVITASAVPALPPRPAPPAPVLTPVSAPVASSAKAAAAPPARDPGPPQVIPAPASAAPAPLDCTGRAGVTRAEVERAQRAWADYLGVPVETGDRVEAGVSMAFVLIPPGRFMMGSPEGEKEREADERLHEVELTQPFYLGKYEVTQEQYKAVTGYNPSAFKNSLAGDTAQLPVESVKWTAADDFARTLTRQSRDGREYRLPTEAEWEYACRGGRPSEMPFGVGDGRSLSSAEANFDGNWPYGAAPRGPYLRRPSRVGTYPGNAFGLHDMHGNVWEWCNVWQLGGPLARAADTKGPAIGVSHVYRGGCWDYGAWRCRAAFRRSDDLAGHSGVVGFRLARSVPEAPRPAAAAGATPAPPVAAVAPTADATARAEPLDCTGPAGRTAEDMARARQTWARHLGVPAEVTDGIGQGATMAFVLVPPGRFLMGSPPDEKDREIDEARHEVELTQPFYLGKYEVTQEQYQAVTGENPSSFRGLNPRDTRLHPVESVSWNAANVFAQALSQRSSQGVRYRLPTEAEWEYACRGGRAPGEPFGVGNGRTLTSAEANFNGGHPYGWQAGPYLERTSPVGKFPANALGLCDMHGNVWEWCSDWKADSTTDKATDPTGPAKGVARVDRGGGWDSHGSHCRAANRGGVEPTAALRFLGFRLARELKSVSKGL